MVSIVDTISRICADNGTSPKKVLCGSRQATSARVRHEIAFFLKEVMMFSHAEIAETLNLQDTSSVHYILYKSKYAKNKELYDE